MTHALTKNPFFYDVAGFAIGVGEEGFERPVDVKVGPYGLVYVLDFGVFNPSEKTMKVFPKTGRVYRIEPVTAR